MRLTNPDPVTGECPARELGVNCATHTYDGLEYLPPPFDRFMAVGWDGWHQATLNLDTNRWEAHPDLPQKGARTGANCAYDVNTRVLWYHAGGGALSYWSPDTGRWTLRGDVDDVGYYRNGVIDPKRKRYLGVGQGHVESWSIDALGPVAPGYARLPTTGATEIEDPGNPGAEYDPIGDQLVAWKGQGDIYTLDLATNVWVKHAPVGTVTPGTANVNGTYGRFRYVPSLNVFVVVSSVDENVFVYRLDASEPKLLRRLEVTPDQPRLEANLRSTLTVNAVYRDGTSRDVTGSAEFRSLDPGIATVDSHGAVHALNPGKARLQASYTDPDTRLGMVGAVELEVVGLSGELVLERLTIEPSSAQVALVGEQRALRVLGHYHRDSNTFTRDVSCLVSWASGAPTTASVVGSILKASAVGTTTLTATLGATTTSLALEVVASARPLVTTLNFQPPGAPSVIGWAVADDSGFDATRGWGWVSGSLWPRGDRSATPDPRLASFVGATTGSFRLQVPDGRYHLAAAMGDNAFGSGLSRLDVGSQNLVAHVGNGNTSGGGIVEVTGGMGLLLTVEGPLNWLAVMPVNGLDFEAALLSAKTW